MAKSRQDDFDMAKLQKSLKQQQKKQSALSHGSATKLTPAEIRSLNNQALAASGHGNGSSPARTNGVGRRLSATPPPTPDHHSVQPAQVSARSSINLPTPPQSPDNYQYERGRTPNAAPRNSFSQTQPYVSVNHAANGTVRRSSNASSYRGVPTYRGPEVTRTGSLTMIQHPSHLIVSNPLSNFSRPRQSTLASSPDRNRSGSRNDSPGNELRRRSVSQRSPPPSALDSSASVPLGQPQEQARMMDSPASMEDEISRPPGKPAAVDEPGKTVDGTPLEETSTKPASTVDGSNDPTSPADSSEDVAEKKRSWRRSLTSVWETGREPTVPNKEARRRAVSFSRASSFCSVCYDDTKPGQSPITKSSLKDDLPSKRSSVFPDNVDPTAVEGMFPPNPNVRPLSARGPDPGPDGPAVSTEPSGVPDKGKGRRTGPPTLTYSRCSCCGKLQKPTGFCSDLTPVFENENLRTNLNFEAERSTSSNGRRSSSVSSANRHKYTAIIPIEVDQQYKQARMEPMPPRAPAPPVQAPPQQVAVNALGDVIAPSSTPLALMPRGRSEPKMVRFASLHQLRLDESRQEDEPQPEPEPEPAPAPFSRFDSLYGRSRSSARTNHTPENWPLPATSEYSTESLESSRAAGDSDRGHFRNAEFPNGVEGNRTSAPADSSSLGGSVHCLTTVRPTGTVNPPAPRQPTGFVKVGPETAAANGPTQSGPWPTTNTPLKLGDWVLPDSPARSRHSKTSSAHQSVNSSQSNLVEGVIAATNGSMVNGNYMSGARQVNIQS